MANLPLDQFDAFVELLLPFRCIPKAQTAGALLGQNAILGFRWPEPRPTRWESTTGSGHRAPAMLPQDQFVGSGHGDAESPESFVVSGSIRSVREGFLFKRRTFGLFTRICISKFDRTGQISHDQQHNKVAEHCKDFSPHFSQLICAARAALRPFAVNTQARSEPTPQSLRRFDTSGRPSGSEMAAIVRLVLEPKIRYCPASIRSCRNLDSEKLAETLDSRPNADCRQ